MNRKTVIAASVLLATLVTFTLARCKKAGPVGPEVSNNIGTQAQLSSSDAQKTSIPSANYDLDSKQVCTLVNQFKVSAEENKARSSTVSASDSLLLDSAQYLLEATINFDFDFESTEAADCKYDVTSYDFTFNASSGYITTPAVNAIYNQIYDHLASLIDETNKIAAVDVSGFTYNSATGTGYFTATAARITFATQFRCSSNLYAPSFNRYILTSVPVIQSHFASPASYFPYSNVIAADYYFSARLNCVDAYAVCPSGGYFYPVVNINNYIPVSSSDIYLPFIQVQPQANYASGPNWSSINYFNGTFLNTCVANSRAKIAASVTSPFSVVYNSAYAPTVFIGPAPLNPYLLGYHWELIWQTGKRQCRAITG